MEVRLPNVWLMFGGHRSDRYVVSGRVTDTFATSSRYDGMAWLSHAHSKDVSGNGRNAKAPRHRSTS